MRDLKRSLKLDVDIQTLRSMREQGMTNKQIADNLGISVSTVYRYIGRKSQQVKYDEIQNKPCPVPNPTGLIAEEIAEKPVVEDIPSFVEETVAEPVEGVKETTFEEPEEAEPVKKTFLTVLNSRVKLQGSLCNYEIDSESGSIEMTDGIITGLLDRDTVRRFLSELNEVADMLDKMKN